VASAGAADTYTFVAAAGAYIMGAAPYTVVTVEGTYTGAGAVA